MTCEELIVQMCACMEPASEWVRSSQLHGALIESYDCSVWLAGYYSNPKVAGQIILIDWYIKVDSRTAFMQKPKFSTLYYA